MEKCRKRKNVTHILTAANDAGSAAEENLLICLWNVQTSRPIIIQPIAVESVAPGINTSDCAFLSIHNRKLSTQSADWETSFVFQ